MTGGINAKDPSSDFAVCLAIASSFYDKPLPQGSIAIGEVDLLGDVRKVVAQEKRASEAKRLGYTRILTNTKESSLNHIIRKLLS